MNENPVMTLADWRRRVSDLYGRIRAAADPARGWELWRDTRDEMFRDHPRSPIDAAARGSYSGVPLFEYDQGARYLVDVEGIDGAREQIWNIGADGELRLTPGLRTVGLSAALGDEVTIFQIQGYGGGLFLPFKDATSGAETYGGGRYLIDAIKGADLGTQAGKLVLDFNFSDHPSCRHSDAWVCPLAPSENIVPAAIRAGERMISAT
jgi:uncharacterized protein